MSARVILECEGGGPIGLGHVYRSICLAKALEAAGAWVAVDVDGTHEAEALVAAAGASRPWPPPPKQVARWPWPALRVVDRRPIWCGAPPAAELVDEVADRQGAPWPTFASFEGPPFSHAIIRPQFRATAALSQQQVDRAVLVCLGGVDPSDATEGICNGLKAGGYDVVGIVGPGARNRPSLFAAQSIWSAMALAQVVVASGGMTVLEAAAMGKPVVSVSHNSREAARMTRLALKVPWLKYCGPAGAHWTLDLVLQALDQLFEDRTMLGILGSQAALDVDGHGAERVAARIMALARNEETAQAATTAQV